MRLGNWDIPEPASDPATWDGLRDDIIGRLGPVRDALSGVCDPQLLRRCEEVCAAAVMAMLWRDVRPNLIRDGRLYIPQDIARHFGLDLVLMRKALALDTDRGCDGDARDDYCDCANTPNTAIRIVLPPFRDTMHELTARTEASLDTPGGTLNSLPDPISGTLKRIRARARADLRLIRRRRYDTLTRRPELNAWDRLWLRLRAPRPEPVK